MAYLINRINYFYFKQFSRWWNFFKTHRKIHSDSIQYNWFWKSRFLYAVYKQWNELSMLSANKCSCKTCVVRYTLSFLVGCNGHTSWLQHFLVTRSSSKLVFNRCTGWWNKNRMYAHRKSLFQSGCHTEWLGLNKHAARMHNCTWWRKWKWPLIYSHLQYNFHFSWTCTAQLWWLSETWAWWL